MQFTVTFRVRDVEAAATWYEAVFGMPAIYRGIDRTLDGSRASSIVCFRIAGVKLRLSPLPAGQARSRSENDRNAMIALMTRRPLAPLRAEPVRRGAIVDDTESKPGFPLDAGGIRQGKDAEFLWICDPDGYRIEFCRVLLPA